MSNPEACLFKGLLERQAAWDGTGERPAYTIFDGSSVVALLAKRNKALAQVVIFPRDCVEGTHPQLHDYPANLYLGVYAVGQMVERKVARALETDVRIVGTDAQPMKPMSIKSGFAVPHAHITVYPAIRETGDAFFNGTELLVAESHYDEMQQLLAFDPNETARAEGLLTQIEVLAHSGT